MVDISQFAESVLQLWRSPDPTLYHHDGMNLDAYPSHFDVDFFETEGEESMNAEEQYKDAGTCYSQDGLTFLNLFDADEHAEYRKDNLFYPFASKEEWEITDFLLRSPLMSALHECWRFEILQTHNFGAFSPSRNSQVSYPSRIS
ncbi:uncharacterized protein EDB93DRAFT_1257060 [Suillus bovinus]|uniref:uncharacterized protein n=1 Tax=Suillus bovinus TaxID=48563 RepID=UPI001B85C8B5|nr:uncharacterized protein EDB93DRAFT_1257060 [Suillus bovinus]KAG2127301.1 hypothetical protein EDB93DRAFT_1257060 [Suillus bovinus]